MAPNVLTRHWFIWVIAMLLHATVCQSRAQEPPPAPPATSASPESAPPTKRVVGPLSTADAQALATMNDRLRDYVELHLKLERSLPELPNEATPLQIDRNQRLFEQMVRDARSSARQGDIFTPQAQPVIKRLLENVFDGPDRRQLKAWIMDENPADPMKLGVKVNARYPDTVPLATIPPEILQTMPKLTEDLEYRFVGDWLILLDTHAHVVVDFIPDAMPK
jgi:hypothetical protein